MQSDILIKRRLILDEFNTIDIDEQMHESEDEDFDRWEAHAEFIDSRI